MCSISHSVDTVGQKMDRVHLGPTYGEGDKKNERGDGHASSIGGQMLVYVELPKGQVPVTAFVSIVRRTTRINTKRENRPSRARVRSSCIRGS